MSYRRKAAGMTGSPPCKDLLEEGGVVGWRVGVYKRWDSGVQGFLAKVLLHSAPFVGGMLLIWIQYKQSHLKERLNKGIKKRTHVVGVFPSKQAMLHRLRNPVLYRSNEKWFHKATLHGQALSSL